MYCPKGLWAQITWYLKYEHTHTYVYYEVKTCIYYNINVLLYIIDPGQDFEAEGQVFGRPQDNDVPLAGVKITPLVQRLSSNVFLQLLSAIMCERLVCILL